MGGMVLVTLSSPEAVSAVYRGTGSDTPLVQQLVAKEMAQQQGRGPYYWHCHSFKMSDDVDMAPVFEKSLVPGTHLYGTLSAIQQKVGRPDDQLLGEGVLRNKRYKIFKVHVPSSRL